MSVSFSLFFSLLTSFVVNTTYATWIATIDLITMKLVYTPSLCVPHLRTQTNRESKIGLNVPTTVVCELGGSRGHNQTYRSFVRLLLAKYVPHCRLPAWVPLRHTSEQTGTVHHFPLRLVLVHTRHNHQHHKSIGWTLLRIASPTLSRVSWEEPPPPGPFP